jgi:hypothetical protein
MKLTNRMNKELLRCIGATAVACTLLANAMSAAKPVTGGSIAAFRALDTDTIASDGFGTYVNGVDGVATGLATGKLVLDTNSSGKAAVRMVKILFTNPVPNSRPDGTTPSFAFPATDNKQDILVNVSLPGYIFGNVTYVTNMTLTFQPPNASVSYTLTFSQVMLCHTSGEWQIEALSNSIATLQSVQAKGKSLPVEEGSFFMPFKLVVQNVY